MYKKFISVLYTITIVIEKGKEEVKMNSSLVIIKQIIIMFILMGIGFFCYFKKIIDKDTSKHLSDFALKIINPILIFMSYQKEYDPQMVKGLMWAFLLSAVSFAVSIIMSMLFIRKKSENLSVERFSSIYSNCAFIGIPLIDGVYGSEGVLYLTAYLTFFNLLVWTHGYMSMKGEKDFSAVIKALTSPSVIAIAVGLTCYLTNIRIPSLPAQTLNYIADMNTPLAMIIAGVTAAQTNILNALKKPRIYLISFFRLLLIPVAAFFVMSLLHNVPSTVLNTVTIATACPTAAIGTMFALQMDKDPAFCSEIFTVTTFLSGITLPVITLLYSFCG